MKLVETTFYTLLAIAMFALGIHLSTGPRLDQLAFFSSGVLSAIILGIQIGRDTR